MTNLVQKHYQNYPYPSYPLLASVRRCDTYALNLASLWTRFNCTFPPPDARKILIAGCGTFAPYPWAVANPDVPITALDLSERSLARARLHCLLHGKFNVTYRCGDILEFETGGWFGLIDSYGVLHHLADPLAGLQRLEQLLMPGGIIRIMLYSRYARREEESIRRAFRLLGISTPEAARQLLGRARNGSRLANFIATSDEAATPSGLADALLHPQVHTYRIDELLAMIARTGLRILLFAHHGALENPLEEIERLRKMEKGQQATDNFVLYLGKPAVFDPSNSGDSLIILNPCLRSAVSRLKPGKLRIPPRRGVENPLLTSRDKGFLRRFVRPVRRDELNDEEMKKVKAYQRLLFLAEYN